MKLVSLLTSFILVLILGIINPVIAEDIDLFMTNPAVSVDLPDVLFIVDNSANWNSNLGSTTKKELVHAALFNTIAIPDSLFIDKINAGLMVWASGNSPKGGKVQKHVSKLTAAEQTAWRNLLYDDGALVTGNELLVKTNNAPYALAMNEALLYYRGSAPASGIQDGIYKADDPDQNLEGYDPDAVTADGKNYINSSAGTCSKKYIVLIGNGEPSNGENTEAESNLTAHGASTAQISLNPSNIQANWADEYARYMSADDGIITYVIDVYDTSSKLKPKELAAREWLKSIARQGQGTYYTASTQSNITDALTEILGEIQAVNSVFAATTLPVSVNVRGTNLNQVYMGVFRPDGEALPRWFGNLKLYQLAADGDNLFLADKNGKAAQGINGFISNSAVSYWTSESNFWEFSPRGTTDTPGSDLPDGKIVEKGAAAQRLRDLYSDPDSARNLYTCTTGCTANSPLSTTLFDSGNINITAVKLGAADDTEKNDIISWVYGEDNMDEDGDDILNEVRPSIHGDVLHSRPAVVNYNRVDSSDDDVVVFYGSNDGVFHAVAGGKVDTKGNELWGFVPEEFFGQLKRLRDNTVKIKTLASPDNESRDYFVDGAVGVYQYDAENDGTLDHNDGDKVYLYLSMRRGGRLIYALDVSNPDAPKLLWKSNHDDTGYGELGQTWSLPKVATMNINGTATPVLIMGAGYDAAANDPNPAVTASMGRGVMVINAVDGTVIWQAGPTDGMTYSISADITALNYDDDTNGYIDRLYAADTGGNIWRINTGDVDPAKWTVIKLATLGGTGADARKFLFPPSVVEASGYDAVLIGSGDREHPFDTTITNRFYMIKDTSPDTTIDESLLYDATGNLIQDGTVEQKAAAQTALNNARGWYITLVEGEKVVGSAVTLGGNTYFNTNQPQPAAVGVCGNNLGKALAYIVNYEDGSAATDQNSSGGDPTKVDRSAVVPGGGYPPSPVPVIVELEVENNNGELVKRKFEAVISGTSVQKPIGATLEDRIRTFRFKEFD